MKIRKFKRLIIPSPLRKKIRSWSDKVRRELKSPRIDVGYNDSSGSWRAHTYVSDTAFFDHPERIQIGDHVYIGHYTVLDGVGGLVIEEGCQLAAHVTVFTHSSHIAIRLYGNHYHESEGEEKQAYPIAPVRIGKYTFLGTGAKIMPGVTIGKGCIIGAGSIVFSNVEDFQIVAGVPVRVIGDSRKLDEPYLKDPVLRKWYEEWQKS